MEEKVKSFLEEGYDFIEESCSTEPLTYTEVEDYEITESEAEASPYKILGVCRGNFQPIGVQSRNSRIYENDHWNIQLLKPEVQERLRTRSMWGTLGHFDRKISDEDIREGRVSHIISKLEIREDANNKPFLYGELEILDTPAGRILEAMYKGGANLYVSSRGAGKLISVAGDPLKHVDKNSFYFEGFDIVRAPGFLQARPVYEGIKEEKEVSEASCDVTTVSTSALPSWQPVTVTTSTANYAIMNESKEVEELKGQVEKLAKIIEKVVDDVYETEDVKEEVPAKSSNEALADFVSLMADTNISEKAFEEIIDMIAKAKEQK